MTPKVARVANSTGRTNRTGGSVDVDADHRVRTVVAHLVSVVRSEHARLAGAEGMQYLGRVPAFIGAHGAFAEHTRDDGERAVRTAMVVQVGVLTRQPRQQPGFVVLRAFQQTRPASVLVVAHEVRPGPSLGGELVGDTDGVGDRTICGQRDGFRWNREQVEQSFASSRKPMGGTNGQRTVSETARRSGTSLRRTQRAGYAAQVDVTATSHGSAKEHDEQ